MAAFAIAITGSAFLAMACGRIAHTGVKAGKKFLTVLRKDSLPIYVLQGLATAAMWIVLAQPHLSGGFGVIPMLACTVCGRALPLAAYRISTKIWKLDCVFCPGSYLRMASKAP